MVGPQNSNRASVEFISLQKVPIKSKIGTTFVT